MWWGRELNLDWKQPEGCSEAPSQHLSLGHMGQSIITLPPSPRLFTPELCTSRSRGAAAHPASRTISAYFPASSQPSFCLRTPSPDFYPTSQFHRFPELSNSVENSPEAVWPQGTVQMHFSTQSRTHGATNLRSWHFHGNPRSPVPGRMGATCVWVLIFWIGFLQRWFRVLGHQNSLIAVALFAVASFPSLMFCFALTAQEVSGL